MSYTALNTSRTIQVYNYCLPHKLFYLITNSVAFQSYIPMTKSMVAANRTEKMRYLYEANCSITFFTLNLNQCCGLSHKQTPDCRWIRTNATVASWHDFQNSYNRFKRQGLAFYFNIQ
eukprot:933136_1